MTTKQLLWRVLCTAVVVMVASMPQVCADSYEYIAPGYRSPVLYDEPPVVLSNVMIPMRDATELATDIYFPAKNGKIVNERFPVLLQRTPYNKASGGNVRAADYFARRGYIVAIQDTRGRYASSRQGQWLGYDEGNQGRDGYDTIEWLGTQSWSTGKVGMWGHSYPGVMIYAAMAENPPHLAAATPSAAHSDYAHMGLRNQGAFEMRFYHYAFMMAASGNRFVEDNPAAGEVINAARNDFWTWLDRWPIKRGQSPLALAPDYEDYYFLVATNGDWPGPDAFWTYSGHNFELYYEQASDIPTAHLSGWYDTYARQEPGVFEALSKIKDTPQWLVMGPRTHTTAWHNTYAGDAEFGPAAGESYEEFILRWMDRWLKGIDTGVDSEPPVRVWVMGGGSGTKTADGRLDVGGKWRWEEEYPLERTEFTPYYLHSDGSLDTKPPERGERPSITYTYDPENPVPTIGGNISAFGSWVVAGGFNQVLTEDFYVRGRRDNGMPLALRPDVVVFETEPLTEDVELVGPVKVVLYASSSAIDTDFTAKLVDVYPPNEDYPEGYALNLADGIIRARYRNGRGDGGMTAEFMEPGTVYEFIFNTYDVGNVFKEGHRIRVDISSSNYPRFDINPNTGEPLAQHQGTVIARNTIHMSPEFPSHIVLPVIPIEK